MLPELFGFFFSPAGGHLIDDRVAEAKVLDGAGLSTFFSVAILDIVADEF